MKHPYIGKGTESGSIVLFYEQGQGVTLDSKSWASGKLQHSNFNEDLFTNITREYLANTKVEIESEEHKGFILNLLNVNDLYFSYLSGTSFICISGVENTIVCNPKQIHIPLPPKEPKPKEWPQVGDEVIVKHWEEEKGIVVALHNNLAWVKCSGGDDLGTLDISHLRKPLAPEEELATKITQLENFDITGKKALVLAKAIINCEIKDLIYKPE